MSNNLFQPKKDSPMYQQIENLMSQLHQHLNEKLEKNNTLTFSEFIEYRPLFDKSLKLDIDELNELKHQFYSRIDPFRSIKIIDDHTQEELFQLPPIFVPINKISTNDQNISKILAFKSEAGNPFYQDQTINNYIMELFNAQKTQNLKKTIQRYKEKYRQAYQSIQSFINNEDDRNQNTDNDSSSSIDLNEIEWK